MEDRCKGSDNSQVTDGNFSEKMHAYNIVHYWMMLIIIIPHIIQVVQSKAIKLISPAKKLSAVMVKILSHVHTHTVSIILQFICV